jgi:hypothetical protein
MYEIIDNFLESEDFLTISFSNINRQPSLCD